jgi:RNA polymerase primary sigma factor
MPNAEELAVHMDRRLSDIEEMLRWRGGPLSLDAPMGPEEEGCLLDTLADAGEESTDDRLAHLSSLRIELSRALDVLPLRERLILSMLFGLGDRSPMGLTEIAEEIGLTKERVRQLRERALRRMRLAGNMKLLKGFL